MIQVTNESNELLARVTVWPQGKASDAEHIDVVLVAGQLELVSYLTVDSNPTIFATRALAGALQMAADIAECKVQKHWPDHVKQAVRQFYQGLG